MELEIVELAKRMREAYHRIIYGEDMNNILRWDEDYEEERLAWVAAAAVARPELVEGLRVGPGHWLASLFGAKP